MTWDDKPPPKEDLAWDALPPDAGLMNQISEAIPTINPSPQTLAGAATSATKFLTPPMNPTDILSKIKFAEQAGGNIKGAAQDMINKNVPEGIPRKAATVGLEMAPFKPSDFAMMAGSEIFPAAMGEAAAPILEPLANSRAAKALGFTKGLLNTPGKVKAAKGAAGVMREEGAIGPLSSAMDMQENVLKLQEKSGKAIGDYLKSKGVGFDPSQAIEKLKSLKLPFKGGHYDEVNGAIDKAIETVEAHGENPIGWEEANDLKGILQKASKYNTATNDPVNEMNKEIAAQFTDFLDSNLEKISGKGKDFAEFLKNKKIYGSTKQAGKALANRISSEMGNKSIGLTDWMLASGGAGAGALNHPDVALGTLAAIGAKKGAEKYGNQLISNIPNMLGKVRGFGLAGSLVPASVKDESQ